MKETTKNIGILILICVFCLIEGYMLALVSPETIEFDVKDLKLAKYDYHNSVSCESDSMGLTLDCNDEAYGNIVQKRDRLIVGDIYVYRRENTSIIHRLVRCLDKDCNVSVFKGDNNKVAEFVNRSQIRYHIVRVNYG